MSDTCNVLPSPTRKPPLSWLYATLSVYMASDAWKNSGAANMTGLADLLTIRRLMASRAGKRSFPGWHKTWLFRMLIASSTGVVKPGAATPWAETGATYASADWPDAKVAPPRIARTAASRRAEATRAGVTHGMNPCLLRCCRKWRCRRCTTADRRPRPRGVGQRLIHGHRSLGACAGGGDGEARIGGAQVEQRGPVLRAAERPFARVGADR